MCYRGQSNVIAVSFSIGSLPTLSAVRSAFTQTYTELYGRLLDEDTPIMLVNARTVVSTPADIESIADLIHLPEGPAPEPVSTLVFFNGQWLQALQYQRLALPVETHIVGPALLMQSDSTCFVEPGYEAVVHRSGNIFIQKGE
jgi:N-methylhydantoinase A